MSFPPANSLRDPTSITKTSPATTPDTDLKAMNRKDWAIIRQHLKNAICQTVKQFQARPADFLSENDIQAALFTELRNEMCHLRMRYEASCDKDKRLGESLEISRVFTEYQLASEGHCDIAILGAEQDPGAPNIWAQPCRIGIEIKFWQAGERHYWNEPRGPQKDVDKLQRYWQKRNEKGQHFTGIAMLFRHPGAFPCPKMDETPSTDIEAAYPEDGVAIHLVSKESPRCDVVPVLKPIAVTAPILD